MVDDHNDGFHIKYSDLKIGTKIGSGGQADVFKARLHGQEVAVKEFKFNACDNKMELEKLYEKIQLIKQLMHRNVVRLHGICDVPLCIITEICANSLDAVLYKSDRLISYSDYVNWTRQIVNGMTYVHSKGVIHRDLKSSNILLASDGGIKICDFDVSKRTMNGLASMDTLIGSPRWMAPEMMRGETYTYKVDIWSFGVLQFEMLTQQIPYAQIDTWFSQVIQSKMRPPFPSDLPAEILQLLNKIVDFNPAKRPDFKSITVAIDKWPEIDAQTWMGHKQRWKNQNFVATTPTTMPSAPKWEGTVNGDPAQVENAEATETNVVSPTAADRTPCEFLSPVFAILKKLFVAKNRFSTLPFDRELPHLLREHDSISIEGSPRLDLNRIFFVDLITKTKSIALRLTANFPARSSSCILSSTSMDANKICQAEQFLDTRGTLNAMNPFVLQVTVTSCGFQIKINGMAIAQDNPQQSHDPVSAIHISGGLILDRVSVNLAGSLPSQTPTSPDGEKNWSGMGLSNYGSYSSSLDSNGAPPPYDWAVGHNNGHSQPMPPILPVSVGSLLTQIQPDGSIRISHPIVPYTLNFPNGFRMADTLRITGRVSDLGGTQSFDIHLFDDRDNIILMVHVTFGRNQRDATVARKSRFDGVWSTEERHGRMPMVFNRPFTMAISADNEKFTIRHHNSLIASYSAIRTPIYAGRMEIFGHLTVLEIDYDAKSTTCGGTTLNNVCERL